MKKLTLMAALAAFALPVFSAQEASAGIGACGDIQVEANAQCSVEIEGGCTARCEPINFNAACAGELAIECGGECNASADIQCTGTCEGNCQAKCEIDPPKFDCRADCEANASADCSASCNAGTDEERNECQASCKASASISCEGKCDIDPNASANCEAQCQASCSGSCEAKANAQCNVSCQSEGFVSCKARLEGGCQAECSKPEGALFCDGQYVDHGGNLQECINALKAELNITVKGSASAECSGNSCSAEASGSASCAMRQSDPGGNAGLGVLALAGLAGLVAARRRRVGRAV